MTPDQAVRLTAILGILAPLLTAFLNQSHWSAQVKQIVAIAVAALIGLGVAATSGIAWSFTNVAGLIGLAVGASQVAYGVLWKPTGVAPAIEKNTAITPPKLAAVPDSNLSDDLPLQDGALSDDLPTQDDGDLLEAA